MSRAARQGRGLSVALLPTTILYLSIRIVSDTALLDLPHGAFLRFGSLRALEIVPRDPGSRNSLSTFALPMPPSLECVIRLGPCTLAALIKAQSLTIPLLRALGVLLSGKNLLNDQPSPTVLLGLLRTFPDLRQLTIHVITSAMSGEEIAAIESAAAAVRPMASDEVASLTSLHIRHDPRAPSIRPWLGRSGRLLSGVTDLTLASTVPEVDEAFRQVFVACRI